MIFRPVEGPPGVHRELNIFKELLLGVSPRDRQKYQGEEKSVEEI
jgi:hypothetical protein